MLHRAHHMCLIVSGFAVTRLIFTATNTSVNVMYLKWHADPVLLTASCLITLFYAP